MATVTRQQNGQTCGSAKGSQGIQKPEAMGTMVMSTCQTWFGCLAETTRGVPAWLELDAAQFRGTIKQLPSREDITMPIQEQLIVELYSK